MTTYTYLRQGPMHKRPYHLIADDGITAVCGAVSRHDAGATLMNSAPTPISAAFVCEKCRQRAAVEAVKQLAAASPFVEDDL